MSVLSSLRARVAAGAALAGAALGLAAAAPAQASVADYLVYPPSAPPLGKTYSQYGADWWKFVLAKPAASNPLLDTTGANCAVGQSGPVWILAGTFGGPAVTRNCTIPFGKSILFPVANALYSAFPTDPAAERTEAFVRAQANAQLNTVTNLKASIDGSPITTISRYRENSTLFNVTLGAGNIFDVPAGTVLSPNADAGYYLVAYPFLPGKHTIKFSNGAPGTGVDVTYNITTR